MVSAVNACGFGIALFAESLMIRKSKKKQGGRRRPRPPCSTTSEVQLQSQLDEASIWCVVLEGARQGNQTTRRRIVVDAGRGPSIVIVAGWVSVRRRVEKIEDIRAELQRHLFADVKVLEDG